MTKTTINIKDHRVNFSTLEPSDKFVYMGSLMMVINEVMAKDWAVKMCNCNAVNIGTGELHLFYPDESVQPVDIEVNVKFINEEQ